jgi:hypothetical protein
MESLSLELWNNGMMGDCILQTDNWHKEGHG